jgi:hypothetical protein
VIEWWPFVALGLVGLAIGGGYLWRAARNDTKHSPQFKRIKRAVDDSERQEQDKEQH